MGITLTIHLIIQPLHTIFIENNLSFKHKTVLLPNQENRFF